MVDAPNPPFGVPAGVRAVHAMVDDESRQEDSGRPLDRRRDIEYGLARSAGEDIADIEITIGQKMLSAVSGSIFTSLLVTPLDVVRVRLQSQQQTPPSQPIATPSELRFSGSATIPRPFANLPPNLGVTACCREVFWVTNNTPYCVAGEAGHPAAVDCAVEETQRKTFNSTFDGLRKIARNEGLTTLWRGLSPTLVMAVPGNVIYFAGYDWLRTSDLSPVKARISDTYSPLVAGSTARVLAALFVSPIELFRTRMQAAHGLNAADTLKETTDGIKEMVQNQGPRALWRGLTLTLWRDVPFSALYWWGYEASRNVISDARDRGNGRAVDPDGGLTRDRKHSRRRQDHTTTLIDSFASGAISGGIASVVTTPFDVGKTRQQVYKQSGDSKASVNGLEAGQMLKPEDRSMPRLLSHIYKEEGFKGLFRGWVPRTLKVAPACAIMISTYELGKKMAESVQDQKES